jgi:hypothetical protein
MRTGLGALILPSQLVFDREVRDGARCYRGQGDKGFGRGRLAGDGPGMIRQGKVW